MCKQIPDVIGELTIIKSIGLFDCSIRNGKNIRQEKFLCKCSCGELCEKWRNQLVSNNVKTCGIRKNHLRNIPTKDISGNRYGRLVILNFSHFERSLKKVRQYWNCRCDCGNEKILCSNSILNGDTKSCGCLLKETFEYFKSKECIKKRSLPENEAVINELYSRYQISAKKRNKTFEISKEEFSVLIFKNCEYCGAKPSKEALKNKKFNGNPLINGIDRKDNNEGYTTDNCVACCKICNYAKKDMDLEDFKKWIKDVAKHLNL